MRAYYIDRCQEIALLFVLATVSTLTSRWRSTPLLVVRSCNIFFLGRLWRVYAR